jgi:hypothetical protein
LNTGKPVSSAACTTGSSLRTSSSLNSASVSWNSWSRSPNRASLRFCELLVSCLRAYTSRMSISDSLLEAPLAVEPNTTIRSGICLSALRYSLIAFFRRIGKDSSLSESNIGNMIDRAEGLTKNLRIFPSRNEVNTPSLTRASRLRDTVLSLRSSLREISLRCRGEFPFLYSALMTWNGVALNSVFISRTNV